MRMPPPQAIGSRLYKYVGPSYVDRVFAVEGKCTLKCGYPSEFNDPYELFLTIDFQQKPGLIAFYGDVVGQLPQLPTTCFSKSPSVIPMWAHYASNLQGFVIEFDEAKVSAACPTSRLGDVDYRDEPSDDVAECLYRAYEIGKFRYMHFLQRSVFSAAYFTKQLCWAYEIERRMILGKSEVVERNDVTLLDLPLGAIRSIIGGPRANKEVLSALQASAKEADCRFLQMKIGQSTGLPYFLDDAGRPAVFTSGGIVPAKKHCVACNEPIYKGRMKRCAWCRIDDSHRKNAADRNSFRILNRFGMLESYLEGVNQIVRGDDDA